MYSPTFENNIFLNFDTAVNILNELHRQQNIENTLLASGKMFFYNINNTATLPQVISNGTAAYSQVCPNTAAVFSSSNLTVWISVQGAIAMACALLWHSL